MTVRSTEKWLLAAAVAAAAAPAVLRIPGRAQAAGSVNVWTMPQLVTLSDVLAVGEVLDVRESGKIPRERYPLSRMSARVRILRVFPEPNDWRVSRGTVVSVVYPNYDTSKDLEFGLNGDPFPHLSPGEVHVFPLRRTTFQERYGAMSREELDAALTSLERLFEGKRRSITLNGLGTTESGHQEWALAYEIGDYLLIPCLAAAPPGGGRPETGLAFLQSEFAASFARGTYEDIVKASRYLSSLWWHPRRKQEWLLGLLEAVTAAVGDDEDRWFLIGTAAYCLIPHAPEPSLAELLSGHPQKRPVETLAATALGRLPREGLEDRVVAAAIEHASYHDTFWAIAADFARHPAAARVLSDGLRNDRDEDIYIVRRLIFHEFLRRDDHPLARQALAASKRLVARADLPERKYVQSACCLLLDHGSDEDFAFLLDEMRRARQTSRARLAKLWRGFSLKKRSERVVSVIKVMLEDDEPPEGDVLNPVIALQHVTDLDFDLKSEHTPEEYRAALKDARRWLWLMED